MYDDDQPRSGRPAAGDFCDPDTGALTEQGMTLVRKCASLGLPRKHVASLLGMSERTFKDRRDKFPEIEEVYLLGAAEADLAVSSALFRKAKSGDIASIRWFEMTRFNRAERVEQSGETTSYVVEVPAKQSAEEWQAAHSPDGDNPKPDTE